MTPTEEAAQIEKRAANLTKLLAGMKSSVERQAFEKHFKDGLDEARVAAGILRHPDTKVGEDELYVGPCEHRYLLLIWTEYDHQFDAINPEDMETSTDELQTAQGLVEEHICRNWPTDYEYRCRVFDLDDGVELRWHEVREVRWGDSPE